MCLHFGGCRWDHNHSVFYEACSGRRLRQGTKRTAEGKGKPLSASRRGTSEVFRTTERLEKGLPGDRSKETVNTEPVGRHPRECVCVESLVSALDHHRCFDTAWSSLGTDSFSPSLHTSQPPGPRYFASSTFTAWKPGKPGSSLFRTWTEHTENERKPNLLKQS